MNDGIKEIGKYMKETGSRTAHALDRHRKNIPIVQRLRDIFDSTQSFDAVFDTTPTDRVRMTLYFTPGLPALIGNQNNCGDCHCYNNDTFVGGFTEYETTYTPVSGLRVYVNGVRTTNFTDVGNTITLNDATTSSDTVTIQYTYRITSGCDSGEDDTECTDDEEIPFSFVNTVRYTQGTNRGNDDDFGDITPVDEGYSFYLGAASPVAAGKSQGDLSDDGYATDEPYNFKEYRSVYNFLLNDYALGTARVAGSIFIELVDPNDPSAQDTLSAQVPYKLALTIWDSDNTDAFGTWEPTGTTISQGTVSVPLTNTPVEIPIDTVFNYDASLYGKIQFHLSLPDVTYGVVDTSGGIIHYNFVVGDGNLPGGQSDPWSGPVVSGYFDGNIMLQTCTGCHPETSVDGSMWTLGYLNGTGVTPGYTIEGPDFPNHTKASAGRDQASLGFRTPPFVFSETRQIIEYELPEGTTHVRLVGKVLAKAIGFNEVDPPGGPATPADYSVHYRIAQTTWADNNDPLSDGGWEPNGPVLFEGDIPVPEIRLRNAGAPFDITAAIGEDQSVFAIHISSINANGLTLISQDDYTTTVAITEYTFVDGDGVAPGLSVGEWDGAHAGIFVGTGDSEVGDEGTHWPSLITFVGCNGDIPTPEPTPDPAPPDPDDPGDDTGGPGGGGGGGGPAPDLPPEGEEDYTFGGDATGATDVSSELQTFLDGVPDGSSVGLASNGTYKLTSGQIILDDRHDLTLVGRNSTWDRSFRGTDPILLINNGSSGIRLDSITIKGRNPDPGKWDVDFEDEHGIELNGVIDFNANNVTVKNVGGDGIHVTGSVAADTWSENVRFHHGLLDGIGRMGVAIVDGGRNVTIDYNLFENIGYYTWVIEPTNVVIGGEVAGAENVDFNYNAVGIKPYGDYPDDPTQPLGYLYVATGASGGGPARNIEIARNTITNEAMRMLSLNNGGAREDINIHDNESLVDFVPNGHINVVISLQSVDGVRIVDNRQIMDGGTFTNTSGSTNVVISGNITSDDLGTGVIAHIGPGSSAGAMETLMSNMNYDIIELDHGLYTWKSMSVPDRTARPLTIRPTTGATVTFTPPEEPTLGGVWGIWNINYGSGGASKGYVTIDGLGYGRMVYDGFRVGKAGIFMPWGTHHITIRNQTFRDIRHSDDYYYPPGTLNLVRPFHAWCIYAKHLNTDLLIEDIWCEAPNGVATFSAFQFEDGTYNNVTVRRVHTLDSYYYAAFVYGDASNLRFDDWTMTDTGSGSKSIWLAGGGTINGTYSNIVATGSDPLDDEHSGGGTFADGGGNSGI